MSSIYSALQEYEQGRITTMVDSAIAQVRDRELRLLEDLEKNVLSPYASGSLGYEPQTNLNVNIPDVQFPSILGSQPIAQKEAEYDAWLKYVNNKLTNFRSKDIFANIEPNRARAMLFIEPDKYFDCNNAGVPPYYIDSYVRVREGWYVNYFASDIPFKRSALIGYDNIDRFGLDQFPRTDTRVLFAVRGQRCYRNNFNALASFMGLNIEQKEEEKKRNINYGLNRFGQFLTTVAPLLMMIPGVGGVLAPMVGGVGLGAQYLSQGYMNPYGTSFIPFTSRGYLSNTQLESIYQAGDSVT